MQFLKSNKSKMLVTVLSVFVALYLWETFTTVGTDENGKNKVKFLF
jgi:hypothetical protein